jgi:ABC-2 type transport system ATP-binding protein
VLEIRGLTKRYSRRPVLHDVSFAARPGEILGYLGPNGAGKSTTVKILVGLLEPSDGEVLYNGRNVHDHLLDYKSRLGYVPEEPLLYPFLTGREYLQLIGRLRALPEKLLNKKIDDLLQLLSLRPHRHSRISSYSKGMKQKVLLAAALLHNPDILVLDEPLSGLDVTASLIVRNLIQSLARDGRVILFSSHVLEVVEKICSRVVILHKGRIVANDSVEHLRELMKSPTLEDIFADLVIAEDTQKIARDIIEVMGTGSL